ncbi:hypothetical protein [Methylobacterium sp. J-077]|uniref:hypothetical protein n=1 Tax=Methylobacterium sp. J-077 TaxID=2836656 RepID=UPI001FBB405C|nr:hypothetical protein [Methylobacterium sp. J-077]MCJ2126791.1 hypothetical protein [Methylobacterium sp. J-077]
MSNVIEFRKKVEPDRFPTYELNPAVVYDEVRCIYEAPGIRLGLLVEKGDGPTPFYLALHDGAGGKAMCLRIWEPLEAHDIGNDALVNHCIIVGRALVHAHEVLGLRIPAG